MAEGWAPTETAAKQRKSAQARGADRNAVVGWWALYGAKIIAQEVRAFGFVSLIRPAPALHSPFYAKE